MGVQELVGIVPWTFVAQIANLFLTVFLVKKFFFNKIRDILDQRREQTDAQMADAARQKAAAEKLRSDYEASIGSAKEEAKAIVTAAAQNAQERSDRMIEEAKTQAAAIKAKASADIAQERENAFREMKGELGDIAVDIAGKVLGREVKEEDHQKLIDEFITEMGGTT